MDNRLIVAEEGLQKRNEGNRLISESVSPSTDRFIADHSKKRENISKQISGLTVQNSKSEIIPFSDLFSQKRTLIIFSRHFNCFVCKDQMKALAQLPWDEINKGDIDLKVVGCGRPRAIASFAAETGFPENRCFVDTPTQIYRAMGLIRAQNFSQLKSQTNKRSCWDTFTGFCWSIFSYCRRGSQGDVYQLGGAFLFESDQSISFKFIDENSIDHIQPNHIRKILGLTEK